ncbi:ribosome-associated translation inhibitor RaiA [Lysinibacter sp. HNR]|uniref:ribosome hibernation-promoting factor, HPF/YfiA family n=1 Tax=Lysinibacter sp. HNR TaxID=3031408 RepID=UPI0024359B43|nr:ribosome-associated translation inhibitor RaiA [Lysinibacter sp. HNR]WGD38040.1 ribosome-associated translation inhibitor RaiA [Lysinibacter sp. HNR]
MEVNIRGRNVEITDRFEEYALAKTDKVTTLDERAQVLEIKVSRRSEHSPSNGDRVELTLIGPGPVIRAESDGNDKFSAFDAALSRLIERVRRAKDRKKDRRGRGRTSLGEAANGDFSIVSLVPADGEILEQVAAGENGNGGVASTEVLEEDYNPVVIRAKEFDATYLTPEEAVDQMELVGHDFYLFIEAETKRPSVVYRRKGWDYGVIGLNQQIDRAVVAG